MATTRAKTGLTWFGSVGSGRWPVIGVVIAALLAGLMSTMFGSAEPTHLSRDTSYTAVKLSQVETLDQVVPGLRSRIEYSEFKLNQIADLGLTGGDEVGGSDAYTRLKLNQVTGDQVTFTVPPNLIE